MGATTHLGIKPGEYDKLIATLIPHYLDLIDAAADAVDTIARAAPAVVDLGTGSGTLVESRGSSPLITRNIVAESRTSLVNGPI